jgi:hypothetical protein
LDETNVIPVSTIDPDTGEITLRCLDVLVNNFNETIIEAIRCNMDIKFIGSASGCKGRALLYHRLYHEDSASGLCCIRCIGASGKQIGRL